jgi:PKD domain/Bacterial pre-peptidase C-terminal domain
MKNHPFLKSASTWIKVLALALVPSTGFATVINKIEPNNSRAQAQNIDAAFGYGLRYGVENSATWLWASIQAEGDGSEDYYSFTVPVGGAQAIFDTDFTTIPFGTVIRLFNASGTQLNVATSGGGDEGSRRGESLNPLDDAALFRTTSPLAAGVYYVGIQRYGNTTVQAGEAYTLNVSMLPAILPLVADAGFDFSVNEGDLVSLDGSASRGPDGLTYYWTQLPGITPVALTGADTASPFFTAPDVALGGETLAFTLTVSSGSNTATDTVNITVVNQNHPPVAVAGESQSVAEGAPVTLDGEDSFDIDNDLFSCSWTQISGPPVALLGADGANPTFEAPYAGTGGELGVVATLVFELRVDDGYPFDAPAPGYEFSDVVDTVVIQVTNSNNLPLADAGSDQTVQEGATVTLSGAGSEDPDGDPLTYSWVQESGGNPVVLTGADTASPSFAAPDVNGPAELIFTLTVNDGYGGTATDTVFVNVLNRNDPPLVNAAEPTIGELWPPDHRLVSVGIIGVSNEGNPASIVIDSVFQDEPTNAKGDGDTPIDAFIQQDGTVLLRAERDAKGDGRTYFVRFTATGAGGSASGVVKVIVPHSDKDKKPKKDKKKGKKKGGHETDDDSDDEPLFDSTL